MKARLAAISTFLFSLLVPAALADNHADSVWADILNVFTLDWLSGIVGTDESGYAALIRLAIWLTLFVVLQASAKKFMPDGKSGTIVALAIATISSIFLPEELLLTIGITYSTVLAWLILGSIIFAVIAFHFKVLGGIEGTPGKAIRVLSMLVIYSLLNFIKEFWGTAADRSNFALQLATPQFSNDILNIMAVGALVIAIYDAITLIGSIRGGGAAKGIGDTLWKKSGGARQWAKDKGKLRTGIGRGVQETQEIERINIENEKLDQMHKQIDRQLFGSLTAFQQDMQQLLMLVQSAITVESRLKQVMQQVGPGQLGNEVGMRVQQMKGTYAKYIRTIYARVKEARQRLDWELVAYKKDVQLYRKNMTDDKRILALTTQVERILKSSDRTFRRDVLAPGTRLSQGEHNTYRDIRREAKELEQLDAAMKQAAKAEFQIAEAEITRVEKELQEIQQAEEALRAISKSRTLGEAELMQVEQHVRNAQSFGQADREQFQQARALHERMAVLDDRLQNLAGQLMQAEERLMQKVNQPQQRSMQQQFRNLGKINL